MRAVLLLILSLLAFLGIPVAHAATRTWVSNSNLFYKGGIYDFTNTTLWQEGVAPVDGDDVIISGGGGVNQLLFSLSTSLNLNSLKMAATLVGFLVAPFASITVTNSFNMTAGVFQGGSLVLPASCETLITDDYFTEISFRDITLTNNGVMSISRDHINIDNSTFINNGSCTTTLNYFGRQLNLSPAPPPVTNNKFLNYGYMRHTGNSNQFVESVYLGDFINFEGAMLEINGKVLVEYSGQSDLASLTNSGVINVTAGGYIGASACSSTHYLTATSKITGPGWFYLRCAHTQGINLMSTTNTSIQTLRTEGFVNLLGTGYVIDVFINSGVFFNASFFTIGNITFTAASENSYTEETHINSQNVVITRYLDLSITPTYLDFSNGILTIAEGAVANVSFGNFGYSGKTDNSTVQIYGSFYCLNEMGPYLYYTPQFVSYVPMVNYGLVEVDSEMKCQFLGGGSNYGHLELPKYSNDSDARHTQFQIAGGFVFQDGCTISSTGCFTNVGVSNYGVPGNLVHFFGNYHLQCYIQTYILSHFGSISVENGSTVIVDTAYLLAGGVFGDGNLIANGGVFGVGFAGDITIDRYFTINGTFSTESGQFPSFTMYAIMEITKNGVFVVNNDLKGSDTAAYTVNDGQINIVPQNTEINMNIVNRGSLYFSAESAGTPVPAVTTFDLVYNSGTIKIRVFNSSVADLMLYFSYGDDCSFGGNLDFDFLYANPKAGDRIKIVRYQNATKEYNTCLNTYSIGTLTNLDSKLSVGIQYDVADGLQENYYPALAAYAVVCTKGDSVNCANKRASSYVTTTTSLPTGITTTITGGGSGAVTVTGSGTSGNGNGNGNGNGGSGSGTGSGTGTGTGNTDATSTTAAAINPSGASTHFVSALALFFVSFVPLL